MGAFIAQAIIAEDADEEELLCSPRPSLGESDSEQMESPQSPPQPMIITSSSDIEQIEKFDDFFTQCHEKFMGADLK